MKISLIVPVWNSSQQRLYNRLILMAGLMLLFSNFISAQSQSNPSIQKRNEDEISWGRATNLMSAGVLISQSRSRGGRQMVTVFIKTSMTNSAWKFLAAPAHKLSHLELIKCDGQGPTNYLAKKFAGEMPEKISVSALPRTIETDRHGGGFRDWLLLSANLPTKLTEFPASEAFDLEKERGCSLLVSAAIYKYSPGSNFVERIDLPQVEVPIR